MANGLEVRDGVVTLRVRVQPKASREGLRYEPSGQLRVSLTAPPVDGQANTALRCYIAKSLGLSKSAVRILGGERSREKLLALEGITMTEASERIAALCAS